MVILDQDLFFIEVIFDISLKLKPLTTSDEDELRIGLSRIPGLPSPKQASTKGEHYFGAKPFPPSEGAIN